MSRVGLRAGDDDVRSGAGEDDDVRGGCEAVTGNNWGEAFRGPEV